MPHPLEEEGEAQFSLWVGVTYSKLNPGVRV